MIELTNREASTLANHLELSILREIKDDSEYDCIDYLVTLVDIYKKCREIEDGRPKAL